jgi:hypothetical protein
MNDEFQSEYERAEHLQRLLICRATGEQADDGEYAEFRKRFLDNTTTKTLLPTFVRTSRDLAQFWQFIKAKHATYAERRQFIWDAFAPLLDYLEKGGVPPPAEQISSTLKAFDAENIHTLWAKALERTGNDPDGAVTVARTLLESVCKHLLDEMSIPYGKNPDLPELYALLSKQLNLSPTQHTEKAFRQILHGCSSVVDALGSLRNRIGDAHGHCKGQPRPLSRHAALAVNLSGSMAMFLVETWKARTKQPELVTPADFPWLISPARVE